MNKAPDQASDLRALRLLRFLVITMTVVMIVGFVLLIFLLVTRFPFAPGGPVLPEELALPDGTRAVAFTQGGDWLAVVTDDDRILIYAKDSGRLRQTVTLTRD